MKRWLPVLLAAGALLVGTAPSADAQQGASSQTTTPTSMPLTPPTTGGCPLLQGACAGLGAQTEERGIEPAAVTPGAAPARPRPPASTAAPVYRWERRPPTPAAAMICDGAVWEVRRVEIATGRVVSSRWDCVPTPSPRPEPAPTPGVVPLPAPSEIWERVPLPQPTWGLSPPAEGLTGLPTELWDPSGGVPVSATVSLGGFTATAVAKPVRYEWTMWSPDDPPNSNPAPVVTATKAGTQARPAAAFTYETRGDFTVTQTVTWSGTYTFTGPGVNQVVDLGTTTTTASRPYHVIEVRGVRLG